MITITENEINRLFKFIDKKEMSATYWAGKSRNNIKTRSNKEIKDLQDFLNGVYYGSTNKTKRNAEGALLHEQMINVTTQYLSDKFDMVLENYDFGQNMLIPDSLNPAKIYLTQRANFRHTGYTFKKTVETRLKQAEDRLNALKMNTPPEKLIALKEDLENLIKYCNQLLQKNPVVINENSEVYQVKDYKDLIDKIDSTYQKVVFFSSMPLDFNETGYIFEKSLQSLSMKNTVDNITDDIIKTQFNAKTKGMETVYRGSLLNAGVAVKTLENASLKQNENGSFHIVIPGEEGSNFRIDSAFDRKQGKVDVELTLPNISQRTFNVSAKNWNTLSKGDFGSSALLDVILRTTQNLDSAVSYGISYNDMNKQPEKVHSFAKMCALLDILAGYSQKKSDGSSAAADTIIINYRDSSGPGIKVLSIGNIISNVSKQIENFSVGGYNKNTIRSELDRLKSFDNNGERRISINKVLIGLRNIKLTLTYSNIKNFM